jgi:hypothetical protein
MKSAREISSIKFQPLGSAEEGEEEEALGTEGTQAAPGEALTQAAPELRAC